MRHALILSLAAAALLAVACSPAEQTNAKEAASKIGEATADVATSPELKAVGSDIKENAKEAGAVAKDALAEAGTDLKQGAKKAGTEIDQAVAEADAKN